MREAVIVSTARTAIGKAYRGAFNDTPAPTMAAPAMEAVVSRAGIDPAEVDDVIVGSALQQGTQGFNVGRQVAMAAGLPVSVSGQSIDRQCSSGLMAVSAAAKQIMVDGMETVIAGGIESISLVQNKNQNSFRAQDPNVLEATPDMYMPMITTAEVVSKRYDISREAQDEYSLQSQRRTAAAQDAGLFADEIVPSNVSKIVVDRETGETSNQDVTIDMDECNRPSTNAEGLAKLPPVMGEDGFITAGNASPALGRLRRLRPHGGLRRREARPPATRLLPWHGRRRLRARTRWASAPSTPCPGCSSAPASPWTTSTSGS